MPRNAENILPGSDLTAGGNDRQPTATADPNVGSGRRQKYRKRLQLSCGECRKKKLSCDRKLPCQRCVRSGRPEQCSFETGTRPPPVSNSISTEAQRGDDKIRELQAEIDQLRALLLSKTESESVLPNTATPESKTLDHEKGSTNATNNELGNRSPRGYYRQHTLFQFFIEIPQLFPFIKETSDEWLKPRGVSLRKNKPVWNGWVTEASSPEEDAMGELLPPKDETDALVSFYLSHMEQLHRIIHVPTFEREYASFWIQGRARYPAMTALVLAMISISICASSSPYDSTPIAPAHQTMAPKWISSCEEWLARQSSKARKLVYYQVSCLVYLAKRMNIVRKKRWWSETCSMIQNAIMDELHCEPSPNLDSPYMREMKRRIWAVLRELDLQNAFEYQLPTLLHNIDSNVPAPANIDDEDFDETSKELPASKPAIQYTSMSYQSQCSRSWALRLEISRRLFSTGVFHAPSYEDVLRYTHEVTQAVYSIPPWDADELKGENGQKLPALASAFLQFQLKECILALHRPYLQRGNNRFWLSETVYYHASRDILLLNTKLAELGIQGPTPLREDLLVAALSLTRVTLLHPKDSTSVTMTSWKETRQTAKSSCGQRFLGLHYKHFGRQHSSIPNQQYATPQDHIGQFMAGASFQRLSTPSAAIFPTSEWLDSRYPDLGIDSFDLDMSWDSSWESPWPTLPTQSTSLEERCNTQHCGQL
ncbi:hypothetical protein AAE478_003199 [Parahypoxylon ruwenzoriense]